MEEFKKGLFSGFVSSLVLSPFDLVRTWYQLQSGTVRNLKWSGMRRAALGSCASQPFFWGVYFGVKRVKIADIPDQVRIWSDAMVASWVTNPLFVFRTRVQSLELMNDTVFKVFRDTFSLRNPWTRGLSITAIHNLQFVPMTYINEYLKKYWGGNIIDDICRGSVSKLVAGTMLYPWEVYRTNVRMKGTFSIREFIRLRSLFGGYLFYVIRSVPQTGLTLGLYENVLKK